MNKKNLQKMIQHLFTVKPEKFNMASWREGDKIQAKCGSVGCVIGHCVILAPKLITRNYYNEIDFGYWSVKFTGIRTCADSWEWCFGSEWSTIDNTIEGAQKRIQYLINGRKIPINIGDMLLDADKSLIELYKNVKIKQL